MDAPLPAYAPPAPPASAHGGLRAAADSSKKNAHAAARGPAAPFQHADDDEDHLTRRIRSLLGDKQNEFRGTVSSSGPHYGSYGTFLPTHMRAPHPQPSPPLAPVTANPGEQRLKHFNATAKHSAPLEVLSVPRELAPGPEHSGEGEAASSAEEQPRTTASKGGAHAAGRDAFGAGKGRSALQQKDSKGRPQSVTPDLGGLPALKLPETMQHSALSCGRSPSPQTILQVMTSSFLPEGGLLSPLKDSLVCSLRSLKARLLGKAEDLSEAVEGQLGTRTSVVSGNVRVFGKGNEQEVIWTVTETIGREPGKGKDVSKAASNAVPPTSRVNEVGVPVTTTELQHKREEELGSFTMKGAPDATKLLAGKVGRLNVTGSKAYKPSLEVEGRMLDTGIDWGSSSDEEELGALGQGAEPHSQEPAAFLSLPKSAGDSEERPVNTLGNQRSNSFPDLRGLEESSVKRRGDRAGSRERKGFTDKVELNSSDEGAGKRPASSPGAPDTRERRPSGSSDLQVLKKRTDDVETGEVKDILAPCTQASGKDRKAGVSDGHSITRKAEKAKQAEGDKAAADFDAVGGFDVRQRKEQKDSSSRNVRPEEDFDRNTGGHSEKKVGEGGVGRQKKSASVKATRLGESEAAVSGQITPPCAPMEGMENGKAAMAALKLKQEGEKRKDGESVPCLVNEISSKKPSKTGKREAEKMDAPEEGKRLKMMNGERRIGLSEEDKPVGGGLRDGTAEGGAELQAASGTGRGKGGTDTSGGRGKHDSQSKFKDRTSGVNMEKSVKLSRTGSLKGAAKRKEGREEMQDKSSAKSSVQEKKTASDTLLGDVVIIKKPIELGEESELQKLGEALEVAAPISTIPAPPEGSVPFEAEKDEWVCCDKCNLWRLLPPYIQIDSLPDEWNCYMNDWTPELADCNVAQERTTEAIYLLTGRAWPPPVPLAEAAATLPLPPPPPPPPPADSSAAAAPLSVSVSVSVSVSDASKKRKLAKGGSRKLPFNGAASKAPSKLEGGAVVLPSATLKQKSGVVKEKSKLKSAPAAAVSSSPKMKSGHIISAVTPSKRQLDKDQCDTDSKEEWLKNEDSAKGISTKNGSASAKLISGAEAGKRVIAGSTIPERGRSEERSLSWAKESGGLSGGSAHLEVPCAGDDIQENNRQKVSAFAEKAGARTASANSLKRAALKRERNAANVEKETAADSSVGQLHCQTGMGDDDPLRKRRRSSSPSEGLLLSVADGRWDGPPSLEPATVNDKKTQSLSPDEILASRRRNGPSEEEKKKASLGNGSLMVQGEGYGKRSPLQPGRVQPPESGRLSPAETEPLDSRVLDGVAQKDAADNAGKADGNATCVEARSEVNVATRQQQADNGDSQKARQSKRSASVSTSSDSSELSSSPSESDTSGTRSSRRRGTPAESTVSTSPSRSAHVTNNLGQGSKRSRAGQAAEGSRSRADRRSQSPKDTSRHPHSPETLRERKDARDRPSSFGKHSGRAWEEPVRADPLLRPRDGAGGAFRPHAAAGGAEGAVPRPREDRYSRAGSREAPGGQRRYEDRGYERARSARDYEHHGPGAAERDSRSSYHREGEQYERGFHDRSAWPRDREWERDGRDGRYERKDGRSRDGYYNGRSDWENGRPAERDRDRARDRFDDRYLRERSSKDDRVGATGGGRDSLPSGSSRKEEPGGRTGLSQDPASREQFPHVAQTILGPSEAPHREENSPPAQPLPDEVQAGPSSKSRRMTDGGAPTEVDQSSSAQQVTVASSAVVPHASVRDVGIPSAAAPAAEDNAGPGPSRVPSAQASATTPALQGSQQGERQSDAAAQARMLKRAADQMELSQKPDGYMRAALKFMEAASWDVLSLFEFCAKEYERRKLAGAAAVAWKCAAVARTRALVAHRSPRKEMLCLATLLASAPGPGPGPGQGQGPAAGKPAAGGGGGGGEVGGAAAPADGQLPVDVPRSNNAQRSGGEQQTAVPGQQGDSPSSSAASDVDNATTAQAAALAVVPGGAGIVDSLSKTTLQETTGKPCGSSVNVKPTSTSLVALVGNRLVQGEAPRPNHRHLKDALEMYSALEAWNKAALASAAAAKEGCWSAEALAALAAVGANGGLDPPETVLHYARKALVAFGRDAAC